MMPLEGSISAGRIPGGAAWPKADRRPASRSMEGQVLAPIMYRPLRGSPPPACCGPQAANRGLAMVSSDPLVLVQERAPLVSHRLQMPLLHDLARFTTSSLRHGPFPVVLVTLVLEAPPGVSLKVIVRLTSSRRSGRMT